MCHADLVERGMALSLDVVFSGQTWRVFAIRYQGVAYAYLDRCTHVAMELNYESDRLFDDGGEWLLCRTHGAASAPRSGQCAGGPCCGGLVKITLSEGAGVVRWHTAYNLQPVEF